MKIYIGIDQSINSTGVCLKKYKDNQLIYEHFYIITNKTTKKALLYSELLNNFDYIIYEKHEKSEASDNNEFEMYKLINNIYITDKILNIIDRNIENDSDLVFIGMEGISYQSGQTKSIIDLAGLSTLIRYRIIEYFNKKSNEGALNIFTPSEIKKFVTGNGNASKDSMVNLFKTSFKDISKLPKIDDIADAYWICTYLKENAPE